MVGIGAGGISHGGNCPVGICPGGICPDTNYNILRNQLTHSLINNTMHFLSTSLWSAHLNCLLLQSTHV